MSTGLVVALVAALVIVPAAGLLYWRQRSSSPSGHPSEDGGHKKGLEPVTSGQDEEGELIEPDAVVLVPLPNKHNEALLLGAESALTIFDESGLTVRVDQAPCRPLPQLVTRIMGAGGGEATRRAQTGIHSGRIVALAPETVEELKRGKPVYDKAGSMLGLVRGDKGRLKHVMRLDQKGAQAVVASNAATLALTAALSQQLASIERQLAEISSTLNRFIKDYDRRRIANIAAVNRSLGKVGQRVRERGRITQTDWQIVAPLSESVETNSLEAAAKLDELAKKVGPRLDRGERQELLKTLAEDESLAYWLSALAESDLALTRWDLLHLYWEQSQDAESAAELAERVRQSFEARQANRHRIGTILEELSDPQARTRLDPLRQRARLRLKRHHRVIEALLDDHGDAFLAREDDAYAVEPPRQLADTATDVGSWEV